MYFTLVRKEGRKSRSCWITLDSEDFLPIETKMYVPLSLGVHLSEGREGGKEVRGVHTELEGAGPGAGAGMRGRGTVRDVPRRH